MDDSTLVEVYRAKNSAEAQLMRQELAEAGIDTIIENENLQGVLGEVPAWNAAPRLMVQAADARIARTIIAAKERSSTRADLNEVAEKTTCLACGARMREDEDRCSQCGWSFRANDSDPSLN
jgi:hypothetical protein